MTRRQLVYGATAVLSSPPLMSAEQSSFSAEVSKIIALVRTIKAGQTRTSLATDWIPDGGVQLFSSVRYKLKSCESVKIDVEFRHADDLLPNDPQSVISKVSLPYLQMPSYD